MVQATAWTTARESLSLGAGDGADVGTDDGLDEVASNGGNVGAVDDTEPQ